MPHRSRLLAALAVAVATAGCTDLEPSTMLFSVPRAAAAPDDFFAMPFPSDHWRRDDGSIDLTAYPRVNPLVEQYLDVMGPRLDGFGTNAGIFVRFDGAIDVRSLPAAPGDARDERASVYLVDVDPSSPDRGARWPLRFRFEPRPGESIGANWLATLPYPGFPLAGGRTYALVVTDRLRGADGTPVRVSDDWLAIRSGDPLAEPELERARAAAAPLLAWLDEPGGDERDDVVGAAVFTTQRPTALMPRLRDRVRQLEPPVIRDVARSGGNMTYLAYTGVFDAPNFQSGSPPYTAVGGEILLDPDDGLPIVQRMEELRVSFTIPATGEPPEAGWPVVIYAHGTGGDYRSYQNDGTARRLAQQGLAVISIDQVLHGPRNPAGNPEIAFFNFQNPLAARDNTVQGAADDFSVVRLVEGLEVVEPPDEKTEDPGRTIRFDRDRIYFFGHSQGGLTGPPFVAYEPQVKGAVLSGAGGLLYLSMLYKTQPIDITTLLAALIRDRPLDEFNPTLALLQTWIERADPVNYGPLIARHPPPESPVPRPVFQSEGLVDAYTPPVAIEALATAIGGHLVAPVRQDVAGFPLRGRDVLTAPVTGNLDGTTVVLLQYLASPGSDGHFVVFDVPAARAQSAAFLGTLAATGEATVIAP